MKIGILSDTHDQVKRTRRAIEMLREGGAEYIIHCGDICGQSVLDLLAGLPAACVWGNNDYDQATLGPYAETIGVRALGTLGVLDLGGRRLAVTHGDRRGLIRSAMETPGVDYVLMGHTHLLRDERMGGVRVINPGALCRAAIKTVALLETTSDQLQILRVDDPAAGSDRPC